MPKNPPGTSSGSYMLKLDEKVEEEAKALVALRYYASRRQFKALIVKYLAGLYDKAEERAKKARNE